MSHSLWPIDKAHFSRYVLKNSLSKSLRLGLKVKAFIVKVWAEKVVPNGNPLCRRDNVLDILIFVTLENPVENPHFIFGFWSLFLDYILW